MTPPEGVTAEQAAVIFRRAAELEAGGARASGGALLDDGALEDIAREVGLAVRSVRTALAEMRAGALLPGPAVRWGTVSSSHAVPGGPHDVLGAVDDEARRNQLGVVRRAGAVTAWSRSPGASPAVARALRGRRRHPLLGLEELRATITPVPERPGVVRVRLEGSLVAPWRLLSGRGRVVAAAGIAGGVALAVAQHPWELPAWQYDVYGVVTAAAGAGAGVRSYRRGAAAVETALDAFLDRLARGAP